MKIVFDTAKLHTHGKTSVPALPYATSPNGLVPKTRPRLPVLLLWTENDDEPLYEIVMRPETVLYVTAVTDAAGNELESVDKSHDVRSATV